MSNKVFANMREVSCKKSVGMSICAFPDVCLSPPSPPAGPIPIPYPNTGMASDTTSGSTKVKVSKKPAMLKDKSFFKKSMGDEAATKALGMGVVSHNIQGKVYFASWSMDVKIEGKNVTRHLDLMTHNHMSPPPNIGPWPFISLIMVILDWLFGPPPQPDQWDMDCVLAILCANDSGVVTKAQALEVTRTGPMIFDDPIYRNGRWETEEFPAAGTAGEGEINIDESASCEEAATTIYHEVWHTEQSGMNFAEAEYDAYYETERWTIERGLPSQGTGLRTTDADGNVVASESGARDYVHDNYPVTPPAPPPPAPTGAPPPPPPPSPPQVNGRSADGSEVILDDGTSRPVQDGDTYPGPMRPTTSERIPSSEFTCP